MQFLARILLSRKIAVGAMAVLGLVLAVSSLATGVEPDRLDELRATRPFRVWVFEKIRPEELTRSRVFLTLPGYIGLAVAASIVQRARGFLRARRTRGPAPLERFVVRRTIALPVRPAEASARLNSALRTLGFPVGVGPESDRHASRGDVGFLGSLVFHTGLLVTMVGVSASAVGRYNGELVVPEGMPVVVNPATMLRSSPPEGLGGIAGTRLSVGQVAAEFGPSGGLTDVSAVLDAEPPGAPVVRQMVSVNVPFDVAGYQLTLHRYGFAPELRAIGPDGKERLSGVAVVRVLPPGTRDSVPLEGGGQLELTFYPDYVDRAGRPSTASFNPVRPVLAFDWVEGGAVRARGLVGRGEETVVEGHRVGFPALSYWADFNVSRDPGLWWVAAGALFIIVGLTVRFGWHEQAWRAAVSPAEGGSTVAFSLSARYFPASLEQRAESLVAILERKQ